MQYLTGIAKYRYKPESELCTGSSGSGDFNRELFRPLSRLMCHLPFSRSATAEITNIAGGIFASPSHMLCLRYPTGRDKRARPPKTRKEKTIMSSKNSNRLNVPEARAAMDKFKMEAASDLAVPDPY